MPEVLSEQRLEINRAETDTGTKKKEQKRIKIIKKKHITFVTKINQMIKEIKKRKS